MSIPVLQTSRLLLRPFVLGDSNQIEKLAGNIKIARTTGAIPHPYPRGAARKWINELNENINKNKGFWWAITLLESKELIGAISLLNYDKKNKHAELGFWVGVPFWKMGYCSEAGQKVIEFGFKKLKLIRIFAGHLTHNPASCKVMKKIGMKKEGIFRKHAEKWGKYYDLEYHGILREEFKKSKQKSV